jgi:hypothetical protein
LFITRSVTASRIKMMLAASTVLVWQQDASLTA